MIAFSHLFLFLFIITHHSCGAIQLHSGKVFEETVNGYTFKVNFDDTSEEDDNEEPA